MIALSDDARRADPSAFRPFAPPRLAPFVMILALLAAPGCGARGPGGRGGFQMPPSPVEVAEVRPRVVRDQFHALGGIESEEWIEVTSELSATVVSLPFVEGQPVAAGALLVQLDDREYRADADRAEAQSEKAAADHERAKTLFEQKAIPQQGLDDAHTALRVAEANAASARARFEKTRIRAPFAGMVGRRRVSPGAYVRPGDVLTELARVDEMKVTFSAPERFAGEIRPGVAVDVTTPAWPGEHFGGRVTVVDPIVDTRTRTLSLVARLPNRGRKLRPGMSADVAVTLAERGRALSVPDEAVFAEGDQSFVYLVKPDSSVAKTAVRLGTRDSAWVEVVSGLAPGSTVVRTGHQKLFEGARVMPIADLARPAASGAGGARR